MRILIAFLQASGKKPVIFTAVAGLLFIGYWVLTQNPSADMESVQAAASFRIWNYSVQVWLGIIFLAGLFWALSKNVTRGHFLAGSLVAVALLIKFEILQEINIQYSLVPLAEYMNNPDNVLIVLLGMIGIPAALLVISSLTVRSG